MNRFITHSRVCFSHKFRRFSSSASFESILLRAKEQAAFLGVNPLEAYNPSIFTEGFQNLATYAHDNLGLTWPSSLLCIAASFRVITLPLYVGSVLKGKRRAEAASGLGEIRELAKEAVLLRDENLVNIVDKEYKQRIKAYGIAQNPLEGFGYLFLAQIPWFFTAVFSLRGMSTQTDLFASYIGDSRLFWCESLALPDPYGILPVLSTSIIVLSSCMPKDKSAGLPPVDPRYLKYAIRGACFSFLPFAMHLPSGLIIFFIFNTVFNRIVTHFIHTVLWKPTVKKVS